MGNSKILALITARSGSKSIPNKNLQTIAGRTLLEWTASAAIRAGCFSDVLISTDSTRYVADVLPYGVHAPFIRPNHLAGDLATDLDVIKHTIEFLNTNRIYPEFIAHLRPTSPLRDPDELRRLVKNFSSEQHKFSAARSVHRMSETAYKCFEVSESGNLVRVFTRESDIDLSNRPKEEFPESFKPNGYLDLISVSHVKEFGALHGNRVKPFLTSEIIEIDSIHELEVVRALVAQNTKYYERVFYG